MNGARQRGRWALACTIVTIGALVACRPKREPLSFTANPTPAIGKYYKLTVEGARECDPKKKWARPEKGFVHLGLAVDLEATTEEAVAIYHYELRLEASGGQSYHPSLAQCEPELPSGVYVKNGQRLRGVLTFEVPENAGQLIFVDSDMINPAKGMDEVRVVLTRAPAASGAGR
jgi:hypothetical protein